MCQIPFVNFSDVPLALPSSSASPSSAMISLFSIKSAVSMQNCPIEANIHQKPSKPSIKRRIHDISLFCRLLDLGVVKGVERF